MIHKETIQKICGKDSVHLQKITNHLGEVFFRVKCNGYDDGKKQVVTNYECNNLDVAKQCFENLTGVKI